eukprot:7353209-Heterocapsa_arctica.AAC.1
MRKAFRLHVHGCVNADVRGAAGVGPPGAAAVRPLTEAPDIQVSGTWLLLRLAHLRVARPS